MTSSFRGILDINTQVRRLGVVSALVRLVGREALSEAALLQRLYRWAQTPEVASSFANKTGKVVINEDVKPSASKRYLQFAVSAKLLVRVTGMYRNTQLGLVLLPFLKNKTSVEIAAAERAFYGLVLLGADTDVLITVIAQLYDTPDSTLDDYQNAFQQRYIQNLSTRIEFASDSGTRQELLEKRQQIEKMWKNPSKYAEHIVPPRLNWLIDLGIAQVSPIKMDRKPRRRHYQLTIAGACWAEDVLNASQNQMQSDFPDKWINQNYFSRCQKCQWPVASTISHERPQLAILSQHVREACNIHKKTLVKRIPLKQVLLHTAIAVMVNNGIAFDLDEIADWMRKGLPNADGSVSRYLVSIAARRNEEYVLTM